VYRGFWPRGLYPGGFVRPCHWHGGSDPGGVMSGGLCPPISPNCVYLVAVRRRLQRIDTDDLLEPVDLDQDERVLKDGGCRDAAEEQVWSSRSWRTAVVVEVWKTPVVVDFAVHRHLRHATRLHVVPRNTRGSEPHNINAEPSLTCWILVST